MTAPFASELLGWRQGFPNTADRDNAQSCAIAAEVLSGLRIANDFEGPLNPGALLEDRVATYLQTELTHRDSSREWGVARRRRITDFVQYEHLARLQEIIDQDVSGTLGTEIGRDYVIAPDVAVGIEGRSDRPFLHAAVSCKWTIRSDRVQNIRHEAVILTRHRRGRQPHIVTVTAEPLPTRLASIARGTGEIDAVYHLTFGELVAGVSERGNGLQQSILEELINQHRLASFDSLPEILAI